MTSDVLEATISIENVGELEYNNNDFIAMKEMLKGEENGLYSLFWNNRK